MTEGNFWRSATIAVLLSASGAAIALAPVAVQEAQARNDNGRDNPGRDDPGRDSAPGQDKDRDTGRDKDRDVAHGRDRDRTHPSIDKHGLPAHPSELGALNAARANENAFRNAAPNSQIGRIAAYREEVEKTARMEGRLAEAQALLGGMPPPDRKLSEINADIDLARDRMTGLRGEIASLREDLQAAGGEDADIEAAIADKERELAGARADLDGLRGERAAAQEYAKLEEAVQDLERRVERRPEVERTTLEQAANKPVTDAVVESVRSLLGID